MLLFRHGGLCCVEQLGCGPWVPWTAAWPSGTSRRRLQHDSGHRDHPQEPSWSYNDCATEGNRRVARRCPPFATAGSTEASNLAVVRGCHGRLPGQAAPLAAARSTIQVIAITLKSRAGRTTIVPWGALGGLQVVASRSPRLALMSRAAWVWSVDAVDGCLAERHLAPPSTARLRSSRSHSRAELVVRRSCREGRSAACESLPPVGHGWL